MKILNVILPESPHSIGHLNAIAASPGWEVHAVPSYPAKVLAGLDTRVRVHYRMTGMSHAMTRSSERLRRRASRRVRTAAARLAMTAEYSFRRLGVETGIGRLAPEMVSEPEPGDPRDPRDLDRLSAWLAALIDELRPDVLHSGPLLQCGPLTMAARARCRQPFPVWLVSNWGSDLQYAVRDPARRTLVESILADADCYFAECERDVRLARAHGFRGTVAGVAPIGGGMDVAAITGLGRPGLTSLRRVIMLKGYQGEIGRALVGLEAIRRCASRLRGYEVVIYGAGSEVMLAGELLQADTGIRVIAYAPGSRSHDDVIRDHGRARISIGLSLTDGLSTWAVEAMAMGAFPVQSATACLDEWIRDGESILLVHPEQPDEVAAALDVALRDDALVDRAADLNREAVTRRFDRATGVQELQAIYRRCTGDEAPWRPPAPRRAAPKPLSAPGAGAPALAAGPVMLNSVPKSGSHMLVHAVVRGMNRIGGWAQLFEGWPHQIEAHRAALLDAHARGGIGKGHVYYGPEWAALRRELGIRMILLYRDPRDVVVSYVHWLMGPERGVGRLQAYVRDELGDHQSRLRALIQGFSFNGYTQPDIGTFVGRFAAWLGEPGVCGVSFEELRSGERRDAALRRIHRFVSDPAANENEDATIARMGEAMSPEHSITFRKGSVGAWRDEFDGETLALFREVAGDLTSELGYDRL